MIGPYFFVDENDRHVAVNGERYRDMLEDYLWPELEKLDINDMWFKQVEWPPRSCDLTPLDFFLWGHIKSLVYANKPETLGDLKDNIQREIANV